MRAGREMCSVVLQCCCLHRGSRGIALVVVFPVEKGLDMGVLGTASLERCRESHQDPLRTLQSQNHPGSRYRAGLSRAELIRDPCHSNLEWSEQPQGLERSKSTSLLRRHGMGHTQLHSLWFPGTFAS